MMKGLPRENNLPITKFESMLKTDCVYFFDSVEFEEIIQSYIDTGKNALAKKALKLGLIQHPKSIILLLLKAELLIFDGDIELAFSLLEELQAIEPTNEEIYIQQASIFSKKDDHFGAINSLKKALVYTDDEADILSMIGMEYLYIDNFEMARLNFAKCLHVDFEDYSSLYNIIYCFDMENKNEEAIEYLNQYIDKNPYCEVAWHQLGRQYFISKNYNEALRSFDYAVLIDEFFVGAYLEKAKTLEELKRFEEAIENYQETLKIEDATAFVYFRIGDCYEKMNRTDLALKNYGKSVHEDPSLDSSWMALTNLAYKASDYNNALVYVEKAIEIDDQNSDYIKKYAEINLRLKCFNEAVEAFEKCILYQDYSLLVWVGLSDSLCALGEFEKALKNLTNAIPYVEKSSEIEIRLGCLYLIFKNFQKGMDHLNEAFTLDFESRAIIKHLFPTVYEMNEVKVIIAEFKKTYI